MNNLIWQHPSELGFIFPKYDNFLQNRKNRYNRTRYDYTDRQRLYNKYCGGGLAIPVTWTELSRRLSKIYLQAYYAYKGWRKNFKKIIHG